MDVQEPPVTVRLGKKLQRRQVLSDSEDENDSSKENRKPGDWATGIDEEPFDIEWAINFEQEVQSEQTDEVCVALPFHLHSKSTLSQPFNEKCMSEVVRISRTGIINFHLS